MTTELAVPEATTTIQLAKLMATSTMLPRAYQQQPANLLFAFEYADAIGIPRINALTSIHVIDGKPTASADLIAALVRRAGHKIRIEGDDTYAEVTIIRADDPGYEPKPIRWDEAKARKAGLFGKKGPWSNYPGAMLRSRALTEAARMWASDALYGVVYTPEEMGVEVDDDGAPVHVEATVGAPSPAEEGAPQADENHVGHADAVDTLQDTLDAEVMELHQLISDAQADDFACSILETTTLDDLGTIAADLKSWDLGEHRQRLLTAWSARSAELKQPVQGAIDDQEQAS